MTDKEKKVDSRRGYCNLEDFKEFGIFANQLTLRREAKEGDIFVTVQTELKTDYSVVSARDLPRINKTDE
jgi:hypothetical protein